MHHPFIFINFVIPKNEFLGLALPHKLIVKRKTKEIYS